MKEDIKKEIKKEIYLIIFKDDDDKVKEKHAIINEDNFWIHVQFINLETKELYGSKFKIPRDRVLKIKEVEK